MKVAIFGAGTMGSGIAQVFAAKGHTALMYASSVASAQKHKDKLAASLAKRVAKGKMTQEAVDALLANILVEEKSACADADLIIECVKEDMAKGAALRAGRAVQARGHLRFQHLLSVYHRDGQRPQAPRHRYALLQSRSQHEAGGDHPRRQYHAGDLRLCL